MTSDTDSKFQAAVTQRDASTLRELILARNFVLISIAADEDEDDGYGALTAEVDGFDVLVVFTTEQTAGDFVSEMGELFEDEESVDGFVVDGAALLDHLPEGFGMLINPEGEDDSLIDPQLAAEVIGTAA